MNPVSGQDLLHLAVLALPIAAISWTVTANHYVSLYGRLRLGIRSERLDINLKEAVTKHAGVRKAS